MAPDEPFVGSQTIRLALRVVLAGASDVNACTERFDRRDLVGGHEGGEADGAGEPRLSRGKRKRTAMISGGGRDHAPRA